MSNTETTPKKETPLFTPEASKIAVENHKKTVTHLEAAAKSHTEAIKHHEEKNEEKAAKSTIVAHGHLSLANDAHKEISKQHALNK